MINDIKQLVEIAFKAGEQILSIYNQPSFETQIKSDNSPLTEADIASHLYICNELQRLYPLIPILSEESTEFHDYESRKNWNYFFLIDPLDGTKEFIKRNGEFTVNIALVKKNVPIAGVIHAPALGTTYHAIKGLGAFKIINGQQTKLSLIKHKANDEIRVVASRSHSCEKTKNFIQELENQGKQVTTISAGSALKFGLVAEGSADIYPRFAPTMEWDTAAGHVIVNEIGKSVTMIKNNESLSYNKLDLRNDGLIVQ